MNKQSSTMLISLLFAVAVGVGYFVSFLWQALAILGRIWL